MQGYHAVLNKEVQRQTQVDQPISLQDALAPLVPSSLNVVPHSHPKIFLPQLLMWPFVLSSCRLGDTYGIHEHDLRKILVYIWFQSWSAASNPAYEAVGHHRAWHIRVLTQWGFALHGRGMKSFVLNVKKDLIKQQWLMYSIAQGTRPIYIMNVLKCSPFAPQMTIHRAKVIGEARHKLVIR